MTDIINLTDVYQKAAETYGINNQILVAIEEMSELTKELTKYLRDDYSTFDVCAIAEEIVDVRIILDQLISLFKVDINPLMKFKIERLKDRVNRTVDDDNNQ